MRKARRQREKQIPFVLAGAAAFGICIVIILIFIYVEETPQGIVEQKSENHVEEQIQNPIPYGSLYFTISYESNVFTAKNGIAVQTFWHPLQSPKGIVFLFHGCSHVGEDWFILPEEKHVVSEMIKNDLIPVSFTSSSKNQNRCWDHRAPVRFPDDGNYNYDLFPVSDVMLQMIQDNEWENLPISLLGASSGASFATLIPKQLEHIRFNAILLYILPMVPEV